MIALVVPADTLRTATFQEALDKAKRFAFAGSAMTVLEAAQEIH